MNTDLSWLKGSFPPLITPFRDGAINLDTYGHLIERHIAGGSHGILVNGTTAEPSTLTVEERNVLVNFAVRKAKGRIPVVAGIWPLVSARNAEFMKNELRVSVPDSILKRMNDAPTPEAAREEGIAIAREMLRAVRDRVQGAQISAPQGRYNSAVDVLEALG